VDAGCTDDRLLLVERRLSLSCLQSAAAAETFFRQILDGDRSSPCKLSTEEAVWTPDWLTAWLLTAGCWLL
jgi:hypothetical protein